MKNKAFSDNSLLGFKNTSLKVARLCLAWTIFGVSLSIFGCGSFERDTQKSQLHLRLGTSYLQSGDYPKALSELLEAEKADADNPLIQNNLGLAYFVREKYSLAETHLLRAISLKDDYSEARNNLARTYIELGRFKEANAEAHKVLDDLTYASPEKAQINIGLAFFYEKQFAMALPHFKKAAELRPENCLALNFVGRSYYELQDYAHAGAHLDRAAGVCKRELFDEPGYYAGMSYYFAGDNRQAKARLQEVTKLFPQGKYLEKSKAMLAEMGKKN